MADAVHSALVAACADADRLHRAGRDAEAVSVLSEAAAQLLEDLAEGRAAVSRGLLQVLYNLAELQRRLERMADALRTALLLRRLAAGAGQPVSAALGALLGAQCSIDSLDFGAAAELVGVALQLEGDARRVSWEGAERALARQLAALPQRALREQLQQEAWHALARFWAATGRLGDAARATERLLAEAAGPTPTHLDADQLALLLAEIYIDQGRLFDFFALARRHDPGGEPGPDGRPPAAPSDARCWGFRLHRATALQMTARLSDARGVLAELIGTCAGCQALSPRARAVVLDASLLLIDVLFCLNRLDDAEALLEPLAAQPGYAGELAEARALITARRNSAFVQGVQAEHYVSPRELTELSSAAEGLAEQPAESAATADDAAALGASLQRQRRRVRADWQRIAAELRLDLHHGALPRALCRLQALSTWTAALDSPLLQTRLDYLSALCAIVQKRAADAARLAGRALEAAWQLELPELSWACCRIVRRAREALGQSVEEVLEIEQLLLADIRARLTPEDRYYYSLNKWTLGEELIRERCAGLHQQRARRPEGALAKWRQHRQERQQLAELLRLYHRSDERQAAAHSASEVRAPAPRAPTPRHDVFTLARQQLLAERRAAPGLLPTRVAPGWLPAHAALLMFISLPDGVERLLAHGGRLRLLPRPVPVSRIRLVELVAESLRRCVLSRSRWRDAQAALRPLRELSAVLGLAELELPESVKLLYIVPDGPLLSLPFALLPYRDRPLAASLALGVLPRHRWSARDPARPPARRGLAVALSSTRCRAPSLHADPGEGEPDDYAPLPNAVAEAELVRGISGSGWTALTDGEAALSQVLAELPRAASAHFSCHGEFIPNRPHESGLVLWDERLSAAQLSGLTFPSLELATLGSCWSGNVRALPGRDFIGVPWTLLQRGAYSSIAALWKVDDSFNLEFCRVLYESLCRTGPIFALAHAQRHFVESTELRHWGSYVTFLRGMGPRAPIRWALRLCEYIGGALGASRARSSLPGRSNK